MNGYFDYNATTPVSPAARDAWNRACEEHWHNASSLYREGAAVSRLLDEARMTIADILDVEEPDRVLFNSGATEANNAVLAHIAQTTAGKVFVSAVEHPSVLDTAHGLLGDRVVEVPVDRGGVMNVEALETQLAIHAGNVALVSLMAANNESGVLQPWRDVLTLCRSREIPFHCDAAQWIGKLPSAGLGKCDYVTASSHKFGGPKGTGFLLLPEEAGNFRSLLGGPQQERRRAGTENYPAIAGMVAAWSALEPLLKERRLAGMADRRRAERAIGERLPGVEIVGHQAERLWNTVLLIVPEHDNRRWLTRLNRRGFAVSTGSACSSGKENPSRVLQATGYSFEAMKRTIRLSAGWNTTRDDWEAIVDALVAVREELATPSRPGLLGGPTRL